MHRATIKTIHDVIAESESSKKDAAEKLGIIKQKMTRWIGYKVIFVDGVAYRPIK